VHSDAIIDSRQPPAAVSQSQSSKKAAAAAAAAVVSQSVRMYLYLKACICN